MPKSRLRYMPPPTTMTSQFNASTFEPSKSCLANQEHIKSQIIYDHFSTSSSMKKPASNSLHHSILALPFDDQKLGRRELSTYGRSYAARADIFSNEFQHHQENEVKITNFGKE